jgi:prepilin-type N-terminal cleavage/methylation domain-containing protein/prepilin-type processing-associated H-X9-DG protein
MSKHRKGFTLVELLIVIGIIAVLISVLLPALARARESAAQIKCAANLRSIGQGILTYASENKGALPFAYMYRNTTIDPATGVQTPTGAANGYIHWSSYLMGAGTVNPEAFQCSAIANGGLPPTDPAAGGFDAGQTIDSADVAASAGLLDPSGRVAAITTVDGGGVSKTYWPDSQAPRIAYTVNEALMGRNKFQVGFQSPPAQRTYRTVNMAEVSNQAGTILATEFVDECGIVSGVNRGGGTTVVCKSHRPVCAWTDGSGNAGDSGATNPMDVSLIPTTTHIVHATAGQLWSLASGQSLDVITDYKLNNYNAATRKTRLDWVGRNHSRGEKPTDNKTNFLYLDGHVELKHITDTLDPTPANPNATWQWGADFYSLSNRN